jgi:hypothetical protein
VHNFTEDEQFFSADLFRSQGIEEPFDRISQKPIFVVGESLVRLSPYETLWLTQGAG